MPFRGKLKHITTLAILAISISACSPLIRSVLKPGSKSGALPFSQFFFSLLDQTTGNSYGSCMAIDPIDGSRYYATLFTGDLSVHGNLYNSAGATDLLVFKQSREGVPIWEQLVSGTGTEQVYTGAGKCMTIAGGKAYLSFFSDSPMVSIGTTSLYFRTGLNDAYLIGFEEVDGNPSVIKRFGHAADNTLATGVTSAGNTVYFSGWTSDSTYSGPAAACPSSCTFYGAFNATTGAVAWTKRWGGGASRGVSIAADQSGFLFIAGNFSTTGNDIGDGVPFDVVGMTDSYLEKVSATDGSPIWIRKMSGTPTSANTNATTVSVDFNNQPYFSINTSEPSLNFEGVGSLPLTSTGNVIHYDLNGTFGWVTSIPGSYSPTQIEYDPVANNLWVSSMAGSSPGPILIQMSTSGGILRNKLADQSAGSAFGMGVGIDPGNQSVVLFGIISDSVILDGNAINSSVAGINRTLISEWK